MLLRRIGAPGGELLLGGAAVESRKQVGRIEIDEGRRGGILTNLFLQLFALITRQISK